MPRSSDNDGLDKFTNTPSKPGDGFFEQLMSNSPTEQAQPFSLEMREMIFDSIQFLRDDLRDAIVYRYFEGKSFSEIAKLMGFNSKSSAYDKLKEAENALKSTLIESSDIRTFLGEHMKTWNEAARFELDRICSSLKAGYKFDGDLFFDYARMMGDAVRCGDEPDIVCWAWYTAIEAARCLDSMGMWDADELENILVSKQHDYGHDNINSFGQIGVAVRLSDKIARYYNLIRRDREAKNEPFIDCLKDMVGYGVISAMLAANTFDYKLAGDSE